MDKAWHRIKAWFNDYWYYYKTPVIITFCSTVFILAFILTMVLRVEDDLRLYICTDVPLQEMQYKGLTRALEPYTGDFNGDRRVEVDVQYINLAKSPQNAEQMAAYSRVQVVFVDRASPILLVDTYGYQYLIKAHAIAALSDYGVTGGMDEYRIPIHGLSFEAAGERLEYAKKLYLVFRVCPERDETHPQTQAAYSAMVRFMQAMADEYQALKAGSP